VANQALTQAGTRERHTEDLGYYLISKGRPSLEHALGYRVSLRHRLIRAYMASATWTYLGSIGIVTAFLLCLPIMFTHALGVSPLVLIALALLAALPASDAATALVNRAVMEMFPPRALPRLELADGVPPELKTLVVVPTLLTNRAQIAEQIAHLGVHYLATTRGSFASPFCRTGRTPRRSTRPTTRRCWPPRARASPSSTSATARPAR